MVFRDKFRQIFHVKDTPHRIAMAFAIGVFIGISPLLGIHTLSAFFIAWFLSLNRFVAVVGVYITNPWTIIPIYSFSLWIGARLVGMRRILPQIDWESITFMYLINKLTPLVLPFIVGCLVVGAIAGILSYFVIYRLVFRYKKIQDGT
jgi:uncharacterized protein (DUF2062 family)